LQLVAAMSEEERTTYINKLLKRMLKEQGLNDAVLTSGNLPSNNSNSADLFGQPQSKGDWYFNNTTLKTQGAAQFKQVWGNRPNTDNWRRFASVSQQLTSKQLPGSNNPLPVNSQNQTIPVDNTPSFDNLVKNVPLTRNN
jgi:hypothetical protein